VSVEGLEPPTADTNDVIDESSRVLSGNQDGKPGDYHRKNSSQVERELSSNQ